MVIFNAKIKQSSSVFFSTHELTDKRVKRII